jgi:hypothetical protein
MPYPQGVDLGQLDHRDIGRVLPNVGGRRRWVTIRFKQLSPRCTMKGSLPIKRTGRGYSRSEGAERM